MTTSLRSQPPIPPLLSNQSVHLRQLFAEDPRRGERFALDAAYLYFDYSKNRITTETMRLLLDLAAESGLRKHIDAMFCGGGGVGKWLEERT